MDHLSLLRRRRRAFALLTVAGWFALASAACAEQNAASSQPSRDELARLMLADAQQWAERGWVREAESLARRAAEYRNDWGDDEVTPASFLAELGATPRNMRPSDDQPKPALQQPPAVQKPTHPKPTPPAPADTAQPLQQPPRAAPLPQKPQPITQRSQPVSSQASPQAAAPQPTRVVVQTVPAPPTASTNTEDSTWFIPTIVIVTLASFATGTVVSLVGVAAFGMLAPRRVAPDEPLLRHRFNPPVHDPATDSLVTDAPAPASTTVPVTNPATETANNPLKEEETPAPSEDEPTVGSLFEQVVQRNIEIVQGLMRDRAANGAKETQTPASQPGRE